MPLAKLFAERLRFFDELPFVEAYEKFDEPINDYLQPNIQVIDQLVSNHSENVPVKIYLPAKPDNSPVIIWMHGGGFTRGSYTMNEGHIVSSELAHRGGFTVVNVEYRLVSETVKFPAPQQDCMAVLDWVHQNISSFGANPNQIFVGGVSAGGCLAATLAHLDRDRGTHYISGQLLNCPVLHHELPAASEELKAKLVELKGFLFTDEMVEQLNKNAVPNGDLANSDPRWWAGQVANLQGLPPAQIINCEYDSLRASGEKYAEDLKAAGVNVELITEAGVPHAHLNRVPADCPEHAVTVNRIIHYVKKITTDS
jgi:acetyl esterase/lipase